MKVEMVKYLVGGSRRWLVQMRDGTLCQVLGADLDYLTALDLAIRWRIKHRVFGVPLRAVIPPALKSPKSRR